MSQGSERRHSPQLQVWVLHKRRASCGQPFCALTRNMSRSPMDGTSKSSHFNKIFMDFPLWIQMTSNEIKWNEDEWTNEEPLNEWRKERMNGEGKNKGMTEERSEWAKEWTDVPMKEQMSQWIRKPMNEAMKGWIGQWTTKCMNQGINELMNEWINEWIMNAWINERITANNQWTNEWTKNG